MRIASDIVPTMNVKMYLLKEIALSDEYLTDQSISSVYKTNYARDLRICGYRLNFVMYEIMLT